MEGREDWPMRKQPRKKIKNKKLRESEQSDIVGSSWKIESS